jgi:hypothetical protein
MAHTQRKSDKPISAAQIKRIHTIIHILGVSDDNYRAALDSRFGVTSCKDITLMEAKSFIDELDRLSFKVCREQHAKQQEAAKAKTEAERPKKFADLDNRPGMASSAQLRLLEASWRDVSIIPDADARGRALRKFIQRITGVTDMRFLDCEMVSKVLCAIKAMERSKAAKGQNA